MKEELVEQKTAQKYWEEFASTPINLIFEDRLVLLFEQLTKFTFQFGQLGDICYPIVQEKDNTNIDNQLFAHIINFEWAEKAKGILLLWRDLLFEQQKTILLLNDGLTTSTQITALWQESNIIQRLAWQALEDLPEQKLKKLKPKAQKALKKWQLQTNPWPTYKEQYLTIEQQTKELNAVFPKLLDTQKAMQGILQMINNTLEECTNKILTVESLTNETITIIAGLDQDDLKKALIKLLSQKKELEDKIQLENYINIFSVALEKELEIITERLTIVVEVAGGYLEQREVFLKNRIHQWLESEIYPLLYEVWELAEGSCNGLKMILLNIRNRVNILLKEDLDNLNKDELNLAKPLFAFLKDISTTSNNLKEVQVNIQERLDTEFKFSYIYNVQRDFLPISLQASLNKRFWSSKEGWIAKSRQWIDAQWEKWQSFRSKLSKEQALGISERVVRCIQNRQPDTKNNHYTNIFMTKGYIGEAFLVGREDQLEHIENIINIWKKGFRGAVLVSGERLSGKTLFAEIVAHRYFPDNFLRLKPNTTITVHGHKTKLSYNLEEALTFIQKYALHSQSLVWIDDLELWFDAKTPFYQNVQALSDWIDNFSTRSFVIVSTNNILKKQLGQLCQIDRIFQAEISMDNISQEAIKQAIWIRHGATHKKLVNSNQELLSPQVFQRLTKKIYKAVSGNVGEALHTWVNSTYYVNDDHVQNHFARYHLLPYFLNTDTALILTTILKYKRTNEYTLRKLFGPMFPQQYATVVKRLISMGILKRQLDGWLEIEELIVNDLKEMIETYN